MFFERGLSGRRAKNIHSAQCFAFALAKFF